MDSEEERLPDEKYVEELAKKLPQGTDKTPEVLEEALKGLPDKYDFQPFENYSLPPKFDYVLSLFDFISEFIDGRTTSFVAFLP